MADTLWLPVTPSIRRIAIAHLCVSPPKYEHIWWPLDWEYPISRHLMLPLHIHAGLAIARVRLAEVNPDDAPAVTDPADVRAYLLEHDPELREAPNANR